MYIGRTSGYPLCFTIQYSQGQVTGMCTEVIRKREDGVGVVCESDLCVQVSTYTGFNYAVGKLGLWR
jgi:hypothetical protein